MPGIVRMNPSTGLRPKDVRFKMVSDFPVPEVAFATFDPARDEVRITSPPGPANPQDLTRTLSRFSPTHTLRIMGVATLMPPRPTPIEIKYPGMVAILGTMPDMTVGARYGISQFAVWTIRTKLGIPPAGRKQEPAPDSLTCLIARATPESLARVKALLAEAELEPPRKGGRPATECPPHLIPLLGTVIDAVVAERAHVSNHTARWWRVQRDIPPKGMSTDSRYPKPYAPPHPLESIRTPVRRTLRDLHGISTVAGLATLTAEQVLDLPMAGEGTLAEVRALLTKHGLQLVPSPPKEPTPDKRWMWKPLPESSWTWEPEFRTAFSTSPGHLESSRITLHMPRHRTILLSDEYSPNDDFEPD